MQEPVLMIRKKVLNVGGRNRPCVQVQAVVDPAIQAILSEHFLNETLFKRTMYQSGLPEGAPLPGPSLASHLMAFVKNDACPEIAVKTLLAGQMYQASGIWEVLAFEYIAKRAFDSLAVMIGSVAELGTETYYSPKGSDVAQHAADVVAEKRAADKVIAADALLAADALAAEASAMQNAA